MVIIDPAKLTISAVTVSLAGCALNCHIILTYYFAKTLTLSVLIENVLLGKTV